MPVKKLLRDLLVPLSEYATTNRENTLREAVPVLRRLYCQLEEGKCTEAGHRNILVLDDVGHLAGLLNFKCILAALAPEIAGGLTSRLEALEVTIAFAQADADNLDESRAGFRARVIKNAETKVKDVMLKVQSTIDINARVIDALKIMYRDETSVLPVYEGKKLAGVVRESDLFLTVADILME